MPQVVVGLDLHPKKTKGTVMSIEGKILKQEKFSTSREDLKGFLRGLPRGTKVALESVGFC
jgi:predicted NBD/HSP70 family sugar kinase